MLPGRLPLASSVTDPLPDTGVNGGCSAPKPSPLPKSHPPRGSPSPPEPSPFGPASAWPLQSTTSTALLGSPLKAGAETVTIEGVVHAGPLKLRMQGLGLDRTRLTALEMFTGWRTPGAAGLPLLHNLCRQSRRTLNVASAVAVALLRSVTCKVTTWLPGVQPPGGGSRSTLSPVQAAAHVPSKGACVQASADPVSSPLSASLPAPRRAMESNCPIVFPAGARIAALGDLRIASVGATTAETGAGAPCRKPSLTTAESEPPPHAMVGSKLASKAATLSATPAGGSPTSTG